jgi:dual specificity phosphatase 12
MACWPQPNVSTDMSRLINEVVPGLFISGMIPAKEASEFERLGITRVIRCGELEDFAQYPNVPNVEYMDVVIDDSLQAHFTVELLDKCVAFINTDARTLVHCWAGISRSATIVIAWLVAGGMGVREARLKLKTARAVIAPNKTFMKDLVKYRDVCAERRIG